MLNFPLDYQTQYYVNKAVSCFGQLLHWHNPRVNKSRVLVKVMIKLVRLMPFSLEVTRAGSFFGVPGHSWSVPIYMLNGRSVEPDNVGNEDLVPPLNVTPHPYTLPFLSELQQHHHDVQVWQQQNAANPWEAAMPPPADQNNGWDAWPVAVQNSAAFDPDYRVLSLRSFTGYEGASMMDGILPEHNETDDPSTWSPVTESEEELAVIEAAADRLVVGNSGGQFTFVPLGSLAVSEAVEVAESSISAFHREALAFNALFYFLSSRIYCFGPGLLKGVESGAEEDILLNVDVGNISCPIQAVAAHHLLSTALFFKLFLSVSVLDLALEYTIKHLLFPANNSRADMNGGLALDDMGSLCWVGSDFSDMGSISYGPSSCSDSTEESVSSDSQATSVRKPRGRPRKTDTPKVVNLVKRSTRNNLNGYVPLSLPDGPSQHKKSTVKKAKAPEVMQIEEMQRLGVEHCNIAPDELSEERLRQDRVV
jgi:hypothetical protein